MNILVNGVSYHVEVYGEGEPLLLLHGFTGSTETWKPFLSQWKQWQLILVDIVGHGLTDSPNEVERYEIDRVAADLDVILQHLYVQATNVLGYSMGGRLALTFAVLYPHRVKKLILESSSPGLRTLEERLVRVKSDEALARDIEQYGIEQFVEKWESIPLFASQKRLSPEVQQQLRAERLKNNAKGLANSLRGMGTGKQPSWWEHLSEVKVPTLLICGELDRKFCEIAMEMAQLLPHSYIAKISGAGHAIHVEQRQIFAKIVNEFIEKGGRA
ncbi:2-succinyl-6-hydroxy-2,4-cyclohexadiene-1-carboxylate synthase [Thermaerobacillus caldiproteolyticus]|uniref:Putative 2-succinyl-6-hydroxy-2,4-cyclohexadiene-1-carboxylate synthase n=1 Tax=Thermaerobacillus caldiproteolyticus TaxID=247480 RepID=A0A7W0BXD8_9BACL|nr:2-succinyl-6-hydroxy-2,4-cyclohexadiene-1-carboxylate synthase [Anoxybacillus caldiproteolyticus]MBA2873923.1 2-succinyl-6-hydroxy-2,4-cyclohexadiene-1-carboxylate synthase [Anoxybacillus caldiproteolyticus]QPA30468.1 2-succinyl-6-hydroxy-2,4-cyclohexadiene-1-carboxylate synthase [Anoxybacillus caldiproteolyticus]